MPDTIVTAPTPIPEPLKVEPTATTPVTTGGKTFTEAELEQIVKDRLAREKEKGARVAQEAADKAALDAAAKNGEWEKVAKQREADLASLQASLKARDLADKKRTIAQKIGLPETLATRLIGETDTDIEADAKALLETLPKQNRPQAGPVANPSGAQPQETREQKRARLMGQNTDGFFGSGVVWPNGKPD